MGDWRFTRDPFLALREGNTGPFEELVAQGSRPLVAFFRRLGAGLHEAEDLTQDVFVKLYRHASRYRAEERVAAFVFRVARNVWIDASRRRAARLPSAAGRDEADEPSRERPSSAPGPRERLAGREERVRIRAAVRSLPEAQRMVFELGAMQGLGYAEIGSILEVPVGTVKSRMFHAVRRLRERLGQDAADGPAARRPEERP